VSLAVLTEEQLSAIVRREVEPLRLELERLRQDRGAELVTEREAARRLGVSVRTVQRQVKTGQLASVKVGASRRVRLDGVLPPLDSTG